MNPAGQSRAETVGLLAGTLAIAEVGLGSLLHALHVPLTGTILSLNQGLFLSRVTRLHRNRDDLRSFIFDISIVTALLKSLSPVGKKLTPMLAIAAQGGLFTAGISLFGINVVAVVVSSMMLSLWGIAQPLFTAGIMFSALTQTDQQRVLDSWRKLTIGIAWLESYGVVRAIICLAIFKCAVAAALAVTAWYSNVLNPESWLSCLTPKPRQDVPGTSLDSPATSQRQSFRTALPLAIRDSRHPLIYITALLLTVAAYFADAGMIPAILTGTRAIAAIYIFNVALRLLPWDYLMNSNNKNAAAIRVALSVINKRRRKSINSFNEPASDEIGQVHDSQKS